MSETFNDMINENLASALGTIASNYLNDTAKTGNRVIANMLRDLKAHGRLDLQDMTEQLMKNWHYYSGQQQLKPSLSAIADWLTTSLGMQMDETALYRALYGTNPAETKTPPKTRSQHSNEIRNAFLAMRRNGITERNMSILASQIAQWAQHDEGDAAIVVEWMTFIGATMPDMLKIPQLQILIPYAHGGMLDNKGLTQLVTGIAKIMLKQQMIRDRQKTNPVSPTSTSNTVASSDTSTVAAAVAASGPPKDEKPNWGGLIRPTLKGPVPNQTQSLQAILALKFHQNNIDMTYKNFKSEDFAKKGIEYMVQHYPNVLTKIIPRYMQLIGNRSAQAVANALKTADTSWPTANVFAAMEYLQYGGLVDNVTAELNHFAGSPDKAAKIMMALMRFEGIQRAASVKEAPAPVENKS